MAGMEAVSPLFSGRQQRGIAGDFKLLEKRTR